MSFLRYQYPTLSNRPTFNRLFDFATSELTAAAGWAPALDLYENDENYTATVELPGFKAGDISIDLQDGVLTLSGERKVETEGAFRHERATGKFTRRVELPNRVDSGRVTAGYQDGILTVTLPKAEEAKPRKISISLD
ncbi:MAG TPA: Hsp20/alpha crystallin family protein [Chthoniobacteraceae bacterium]|jgi:HSP20 family protein|nr:Hsp20/alpha crystallin family protein [Chthoniobacteraceae bacterium]